jgi:putative N6-adenine-specific DNA methylase
MREQFFVTCAPHVEAVLHDEVRALKLAHVERQVGGVYFEGTLVDAGRANLWLRTAVRVLMRVARFQAADGDALLAGAREVAWERFLAPEGSLAVQAHARESALDHSLFVEQRVKDAICDRFRARTGTRPSVDKDEPDLSVVAHLYRDRCTLLVDTSGESLHKRGWRRDQGRAPLSETLAAAVVLLSGWDRRAPLLDPFCGSATLLVEAACLALGRAPGSFRTAFGFERWPSFGAERSAWERERAAARPAPAPLRLLILGSDSSARALAGARANLAAAGLAESVQLAEADARDFAPRRGWNGWIVTNPPYGRRLKGPSRLDGVDPGDTTAADGRRMQGPGDELAELYADFGRALRERCHGYHAAVLSGNPRLADRLGIDWRARLPLLNGALECELLLTQLG